MEADFGIEETDIQLASKFVSYMIWCRKNSFSSDDLVLGQKLITDVKKMWVKSFPPKEFSYGSVNFDTSM